MQEEKICPTLPCPVPVATDTPTNRNFKYELYREEKSSVDEAVTFCLNVGGKVPVLSHTSQHNDERLSLDDAIDRYNRDKTFWIKRSDKSWKSCWKAYTRWNWRYASFSESSCNGENHSVLCQKDRNTCEPSYCSHNGRCVLREGRKTCSCNDPYMGEHCETNSKPCISSPTLCLNGGTCVNRRQSIGGRWHDCRCNPGFKGDDCEEEIRCSIPEIDGVRVVDSSHKELTTSDTIGFGDWVVFYCEDINKRIYGIKSASCDNTLGKLNGPNGCE